MVEEKKDVISLMVGVPYEDKFGAINMLDKK